MPRITLAGMNIFLPSFQLGTWPLLIASYQVFLLTGYPSTFNASSGVYGWIRSVCTKGIPFSDCRLYVT
jgi:hypothetical protein